MAKSMNLSKRLLSFSVALPLLVLLLQNAIIRFFLGIVIVILCTYELQSLDARLSNIIKTVHCIVAASMMIAALQGAYTLLLSTFGAQIFLAIFFIIRHARGKAGSLTRDELASFGIQVFGLIYTGALLSHIMILNWCPFGLTVIVYLLLVTFVGENAALFVGAAFGRIYPVPALSSNKTLIGFVAAITASSLSSVIFCYIGETYDGYFEPLPVSLYFDSVMLGLLMGFGAAFGDLLESFFKRCNKAKDAGQIMPGWGGMLDRVDGVLLNAPLVYYWLVFRSTTPLLQRCSSYTLF